MATSRNSGRYESIVVCRTIFMVGLYGLVGNVDRNVTTSFGERLVRSREREANFHCCISMVADDTALIVVNFGGDDRSDNNTVSFCYEDYVSDNRVCIADYR